MYFWIIKYIILLSRSKAKMRFVRKLNAFDIFNIPCSGILSLFSTFYFVCKLLFVYISLEL